MELLSITNIEKFERQGNEKNIIFVRKYGILKKEIYWNFPDNIIHSAFTIRPIDNSNDAMIFHEGIVINYNEDHWKWKL